MDNVIPRKRALLVVANPSVSTTLGWPAGFWASELTHVYYELSEAGVEVTIASPQGGKVEMDAYSNPLNPDGYAKDDILTLGYLHHEPFMLLLDDTPSVSSFSPEEFDAIVIAGGQSPMFTFDKEESLQRLFSQFYESGKIAAALCHGTALLLHCQLTDGTPLLLGRTITGFTNEEEEYFDRMVGQTVMPFRIEDRAIALGADFVKGQPFEAFAVQDGRLITGQQQSSGKKTARLVIQALSQTVES